MKIAEAAVSESCCLEIAFHCLMTICLRGNKELAKKVKQLCKNIEASIQDPALSARCQTIFLLIDKFCHRGKNHFDTSFFPPLELPAPNIQSGSFFPFPYSPPFLLTLLTSLPLPSPLPPPPPLLE